MSDFLLACFAGYGIAAVLLDSIDFVLGRLLAREQKRATS